MLHHWRSSALIASTLLAIPAFAQTTTEKAAPAKAAPRSSVGPADLTAKAWAIADGKTGKVLWGFNEAEPRAIASTTKIMTAYVVLKQAEKDPNLLDEEMVFSERAKGVGGSSSRLDAGERLPVREMLYGLLLPSGNDASVALAEKIGPRCKVDGDGNESDPVALFIAQMNRCAQELKMTETKFFDTSGLRPNKASARDMVKLNWNAMQNKQFRNYVGTKTHKSKVIDAFGDEWPVVWNNTNRLLGTEGYDGVKTGTTSAAGNCLVSSGHKGADHLFVVVLGSTSTGTGAARIDNRYVDTKKLFAWAWQQRGHDVDQPVKEPAKAGGQGR